jgi:predicted amidohydrolase YtcJ
MRENEPGRGPGTHADLVFAGGPVYTLDAARSWTDAVAVRDGRIIARGGTAVRSLVGPSTDVVGLSLGDALAAYTIGSAWVSHLDHVTGSIETGKYADLVVLDRNPFAGRASAIADTRVEMTFAAGTAVYTRRT